MFLSKDVALIFEQATELININIDAALEEFNDGINRAKECMMKILTLGKIKNNLWFDSECRETVSYTHLTLPTNHRV